MSGATVVGLIPEGDEIEPAEKVTKTFYVPTDLLADLERIRKDLKYKNLSKLVVAALRYFVEQHDKDRKKK